MRYLKALIVGHLREFLVIPWGEVCMITVDSSLDAKLFKLVEVYSEDSLEMRGHSVVQLRRRDCLVTAEVFHDSSLIQLSYTWEIVLKWQAT